MGDNVMEIKEYQIGDRIFIEHPSEKGVDRGVITNRWFSRAHNQFTYDVKTDDNGRGYALANSLELDTDKMNL